MNDLNKPKLNDSFSNVEHAWVGSGHKGKVTRKRGLMKQRSPKKMY